MSRLSPVFCFASVSLLASAASAQSAPIAPGVVPVSVKKEGSIMRPLVPAPVMPALTPHAPQWESAQLTRFNGAASVIAPPIPAKAKIARPKVLTASLPALAAPGVVKNEILAPISAPLAKKLEDPAPALAAPKILSSRNADPQRLMLMRMDADLARAEKRLGRAEKRLAVFQRQLGSVTTVLQSAMLEVGDNGKGLHPFVRVGQRYLGTPYVWGGESGRGFDCSGFIMRVMRDLGYRALPHSAAEQFRYGTPIARELLQAGDIVFFANTYKPGVSHVGIYLGRGRFIHAANSKQGTIVSGLNEAKWVKHYAGARRLVRGGS